jgi:hypothetical protein
MATSAQEGSKKAGLVEQASHIVGLDDAKPPRDSETENGSNEESS